MKQRLAACFLVYAILWLPCLSVGYADGASKEQCFKTLFQFGASLFDTGNAVIAFPRQAFQPTRPPYGFTFPGYPAHRFSDGKLIIDYLGKISSELHYTSHSFLLSCVSLTVLCGVFSADAFKLELLHPYLESTEPDVTNKAGTDYRRGVCFAVALATALSVEELNFTGMGNKSITLNPLTSDVQFEWFESFRERVFESGTKSEGMEYP